MQINKPNNYAFIDSQNVHLGILSCGWKIDWQRFRVWLREKFSVTSAYVFIGYLPGNENLYTFFQESGFICVFKPVLIYKNNLYFISDQRSKLEYKKEKASSGTKPK